MKPRTRKPEQPADPMVRAYAVAEGLAAAAVRRWAVSDIDSLDRSNDLGAVYDAITQYSATGHDPSTTAYESIERHIADPRMNAAASDAVTGLMTQAQDSGYLYGLAVGLALSRGGAR